jgi:hypothetical protein
MDLDAGVDSTPPTGRSVRNLVVQRIPKEELEEAQSIAEAKHFPNLPAGRGYEEWTAVSHTFLIQSNGDGLLTILFERPA